MFPPRRVTGQKAAQSNVDDEEPVAKRLNTLHIDSHASEHEQRSKKKRPTWISKESDPEVLNLRDFKYIWRTDKRDSDEDNDQITGCQCERNECARGICECVVGNVRLNEQAISVKNPIRLSRHFYDTNYSECTVKCACRGRCNVRFRTAKPQYTLVVKRCEASGKGFGVFTKDPIPAGSFVCELSGKFIPFKKWKATTPSEFVYCFDLHNPWTHGYAEVKAYHTCIDARNSGNESRFINSSCTPNLVLLKSRNHLADHLPTKILFIAMRDIAKNEELTFFYGRQWLQYMREDNSTFVCLCKTKQCMLPSVESQIDMSPLPFKNDRLFPSYESSDEEDDTESTSYNKE